MVRPIYSPYLGAESVSKTEPFQKRLSNQRKTAFTWTENILSPELFKNNEGTILM